jgi:ribosomal protein S18 acetylase RimI-like enzyme
LPADLRALHQQELAVVGDGRGTVWALEDIRDVAAFEERFAPFFDRASRDDHCLFVAEVDGSVAGCGIVRRVRPTFMRHVGVFSLEVHTAYQRRGIGRALLRQCVAWARENGIERFELYTRSDNDRARALYESEGFVHEGTRQRFVRLPEGTYVDDVVYVRFLCSE